MRREYLSRIHECQFCDCWSDSFDVDTFADNRGIVASTFAHSVYCNLNG